MTDPITITIDRVGRLVIPKEIRDEAGIEPGMTLEVKKGRLQVAESVETGVPLTRATVRKTGERA